MNYEEIDQNLSSNSLMDILHQIPAGVVIAEAPTGRMILNNKTAEEILGRPVYLAKNIEDYGRYSKGYDLSGMPYGPKDWPLSRTIMYGDVVKGELINFTRDDGKHIIIKVNSSPIYDANHKIVAAIVTFFDITAQMEAEKLAEESLQKYQNLLDTIDGIVWESDADFRFTFVSQRAERLTGFTKEEWTQPNFWADHILPEDRDKAVNFCKEQVAKMLPHDFEYRFMTKDGRVLWLRDIVSVVTVDGFFTGLRGIMVDITERKHILELLKQREEWLKTILEHQPECVQIMNEEGILLEINPAGLAMYEAEDANLIVGKCIYPLIVEQYRIAFQEVIKNACLGEKGRIEYEIEGLKGTHRWQEVQAVPLAHRDKHILALVIDTTEKKKKEQVREQRLTEEMAARLNAEKSVHARDDFLSMASHELRTPLTPIRLEIQMVKRYLQKNTGSIPNLELILKHLDEADRKFCEFLKLVNNLLDVSRINADRLMLSKEEMNLTSLVEYVSTNFLPDIKSNGCTLDLDLEPNVTGYWDKIRIEQVIVNLLSNAEKYGKGKPIKISLKKKTDSSNNTKAVLRIQDHGIGISKEDQAKLFQKFERVAPSKTISGIGLGLFISQSIIDAHHGEISVESEPGQGSTFTVELPLK